MKKAIIEGNYSYTHNFRVTVHTDILIQCHLPFCFLSVLSHSFGFFRYLVTLEHKALWKNITGLERRWKSFVHFRKHFAQFWKHFPYFIWLRFSSISRYFVHFTELFVYFTKHFMYFNKYFANFRKDFVYFR